jgi:hypothetical protein
LKSSILGGRVLRARTPTGVEQEIYALLVVYHLLRTATADATATQPDTDPDRASFTIAWQTARDQLIQAANVLAGTVIDLVAMIGQARSSQPATRPTATGLSPHRQTSHLHIPSPGTEHRPDQLPGHLEHRHPRRHVVLTTPQDH